MSHIAKQTSIALLLSTGLFALSMAATAMVTRAEAAPACTEDCADAPSEGPGTPTPDVEIDAGGENASTGEPAGDSESETDSEGGIVN